MTTNTQAYGGYVAKIEEKAGELAGHSSLNTTMIYTHVVMDELQVKIKRRKGIT